MRNNRNILARLVVLLLLLVVVLVGWSFLHRKPTLTVGTTVKVSGVFANATTKGGGSFVVASSGQFLVYDTQNGGQSNLTANVANTGVNNPDSLTLSSSGKYLLFHQFVPTGSSMLTTALSANGLPLGSDYWFVYAIDTQTFSPLPDSVLRAKFNGDTIVALGVDDSGETLATYDPVSLQSTSTIPVTGASDFFASGDGYFIQATNGDVFFTKDGVVSKRVLTNSNVIGVTKDGSHAVASQRVKQQQNLVLVNLSDYSTQTLASNVSGKFAWDTDGVVLFGQVKKSAVDKPQLTSYDITAKKFADWKVSENQTLQYSQPVVLLNAKTAVTQAQNGSYYILSGDNISQTASTIH